jgi:hypothetical protein
MRREGDEEGEGRREKGEGGREEGGGRRRTQTKKPSSPPKYRE